jgi:AhpD family alkylhydroperoxidase
MPIVAPLPADHSAEVAELARFFFETLGFVPNSVLTMQRRPGIAKAFIGLNKAVMENHGRVTSEQKRLIGYLASQVAGCRYCQAHTMLAARRYGAKDERLAAAWEYRASPLFTPAEKSAFDFAVAAASVPNAVTPEIADAMRAFWDEGEIVEILGVISLFGFLNRWNDSMATSLEPGAEEIGAEVLARSGWRKGKHA